ncbi:MAG: helix-turn-helix transcriptional regulator [Pseudomonadota bacterium]
MTDDRLISTSELCERYGRSVRTINRWQHQDDFPEPVIRGGHGSESRWREADIKAWEARRSQAA